MTSSPKYVYEIELKHQLFIVPNELFLVLEVSDGSEMRDAYVRMLRYCRTSPMFDGEYMFSTIDFAKLEKIS